MDWLLANHSPRSMTSLMLEESSPLFAEEWEQTNKQRRGASLQVGSFQDLIPHALLASSNFQHGSQSGFAPAHRLMSLKYIKYKASVGNLVGGFSARAMSFVGFVFVVPAEGAGRAREAGVGMGPGRLGGLGREGTAGAKITQSCGRGGGRRAKITQKKGKENARKTQGKRKNNAKITQYFPHFCHF